MSNGGGFSYQKGTMPVFLMPARERIDVFEILPRCHFLKLQTYPLPNEAFTRKLSEEERLKKSEEFNQKLAKKVIWDIYCDERIANKAAVYGEINVHNADEHFRNSIEELRPGWIYRKTLLQKWELLGESLALLDTYLMEHENDEANDALNAAYTAILEAKTGVETTFEGLANVDVEAEGFDAHAHQIQINEEVQRSIAALEEVISTHQAAILWPYYCSKQATFKKEVKSRYSGFEYQSFEAFQADERACEVVLSHLTSHINTDRARAPEWLHSVADVLGGPTELFNLTAGSWAANRRMLTIENAIKKQPGIGIEVISFYHPGTRVGVWYQYTVFAINQEAGQYQKVVFDIDAQREWYSQDEYDDDKKRIQKFLDDTLDFREEPTPDKCMPMISEKHYVTDDVVVNIDRAQHSTTLLSQKQHAKRFRKGRRPKALVGDREDVAPFPARRRSLGTTRYLEEAARSERKRKYHIHELLDIFRQERINSNFDISESESYEEPSGGQSYDESSTEAKPTIKQMMSSNPMLMNEINSKGETPLIYLLNRNQFGWCSKILNVAIKKNMPIMWHQSFRGDNLLHLCCRKYIELLL